MPRPPIDMTGMRFGRLLVINKAESRNQQAMWNCVCDCGNVCVASGNSMRRGKTLSCGCVYKETRAEIAHKSIAKLKHGESFERLYFIWNDIKGRCNNKKDISYPHYGGRGIKVCEEWSNDYCSFKVWAEANGYNKYAKRGECTIDRIDVNGDYTPDNCRWITIKEQCKNKTNTIRICINGESLTPSEWAEKTGLSRSMIYSRYKRGWPECEILSPPTRIRCKNT